MSEPTNDATNDPVAEPLDAYFRTHEQRIRAELFDFLRIPSVSARSEHRADMSRAAEWLADSLRAAGLATEIHETAGHPIVLGERRAGGPDAPTVLIYGHYDVQPAEPFERWQSPPFEPEIRDGRIYARGATDDKGQLFLHVKALEALLATRGELPVNVLLLAEGEEEIGGPHLVPFVEAHAERLRADAVVISDSAMFAPGVPAFLSSLRGMAYFQIDAFGPEEDLHSGSYGGAVVNPAQALAKIVASLHDEAGRIAIPGFYGRVRESAELSRRMAELPFEDESFRQEARVPALGGEAGKSTLERLWTRPTCEVNGLLSGFTGEGVKTVIPARAMAKVSCRLVADQDPAEIDRLFRAHVERWTPPGVRVEVALLAGGPAWQAELAGPLYEAASRALAATFGRPPVVMGDGGSLPIVPDFERLLGAPVLLLGFGLPGENAHGPNEWLSLDNFERGMRTVARLWEELAA
ncbi:MAG TPA: dipeptidase [Thermoanaerobaculia bacterium]|jgi:acetylornithine deacetylase/succinyl-diaminopimelate desuccinylase-like protein|nr:dipeptidase [Thermoanaerobaculia bacterium]